ncbi:Uncharacterised protein [uncultured archaeon]|nr:Uncharacterised protein [uncultured archaeon]
MAKKSTSNPSGKSAARPRASESKTRTPSSAGALRARAGPSPARSSASGRTASGPSGLGSFQSSGSSSSAAPSWPPEKPRALAARAFARLRAGMESRGLLEGATTYAFLFNQLKAYLALAPERPFPSLGGEPVRLSPAGHALDALAKATALDIVEQCKHGGLPPAALGAVYDEMVPLYLQAVKQAFTHPPRPRPVPSGPRMAGGPSFPSAPPPAPPEPGEAPPGPGVSPMSGRYASRSTPPIVFQSSTPLRAAPPIILSPSRRSRSGITSMRSFVPSRSIGAAWRVEYGRRLGRLVADLRQLLSTGPQMFGPIPPAKRQYIERLLGLIEEHQRRYAAGREPQPFRFSIDERNQLENFCPAFRLRGLDWLELKGPQSS